MKASPPLTALHTLLTPEDPSSSTSDRAGSLAAKIATATSVLTSTPSLHPLALEVISNGLLVQCSIVKFSSPHHPPPDGPLTVTLGEVWPLLDSLLDHCPQGWSPRLFKWCVTLLGQVSVVSPGPTGLEEALRMWLTTSLLTPLIVLLNKSTTYLVSKGRGLECMETLFPVCSQHSPNLNWLLAYVVSLHPSRLTGLLLNHALSSVLTSGQSLITLVTEVFDHTSRTHRNALRQCVVDKVREVMSENTEEEGGVSREGGGGGGGGDGHQLRFRKLISMIQIAIGCQSLLEVAAEETLKIVSADKILAFVMDEKASTPTVKSRDDVSMSDDDEEDEGEILSDEEEMKVGGVSQSEKGLGAGMSIDETVPLLSRLICQLPGKEACAAICIILDVHRDAKKYLKAQEACIEEGEIVRESSVHHVIKCCCHVVSEIISRLHAAASSPRLAPGGGGGGGGDGRDLEFAVGLQEAMLVWCDKLLAVLEQKGEEDVSVDWLQDIVVCACVSSPELQAARALSHLLCHSHLPTQVSAIISVFKEIQVRHFRLAHSTIQCTLTSLQHLPPYEGTPGSGGPERNILCNFALNMTRILKGKLDEDKEVRSQFHSSLYEQLLPLTQLVALTIPTAPCSKELVLTFDLMRSVLASDDVMKGVCLTMQSRNRMLQALLIHHFTLLKMLGSVITETGHTHVGLEAALSKSRWLIFWCTSAPSLPSVSLTNGTPLCSSSARVMAFNTIIETIVSKEMRAYFSSADPSQLSPFSSSSFSSLSLPRAELLATNFHSGLSRSCKPNFTNRHFQHYEQMKENKKRQKVNPSHRSLSSSHLTSHVTQLLLAVCPPSPSPSFLQAQRELATVLLDTVAPQSLAVLKVWPDEETLKYSLERDLAIKHVFEENPILWECLRVLSDSLPGHAPTPGGSSGLIVCASIVRSMLTVLTQHWQRCCVDTTTRFPRELECSIFLIECMAKGCWISPPLSYIGELFPRLTPHEIALLLTAVNTFIKANFLAINSRSTCDFKDAELIKGILVKNIHHFGHLFSRFIPH